MALILSNQFNKTMGNYQNAKIARSLARKEEYESIVINTNDNEIFARGKFLYYGTMYTAKVNVDVNTNEVTYFHCNCPWCKTYSGCGHVGALLIILESLNETDLPYITTSSYFERMLARQQEEERLREEAEKFKKRRLSRNLVESFRSEFQKEKLTIETQDQLNLFPSISTLQDYANVDMPALSFKISTPKPFVVKNVWELVNKIENNENLSFGKNLSIRMSYDLFSEEDQQLIKWIRSNIHTQDKYLSSNHRYFIIDKYCIDSFFDFFTDSSYDLNLNFEEVSEKSTLTFTSAYQGYEMSIVCPYYCLSKKFAYAYFPNEQIVTRYTFKHQNQTINFMKKIVFNQDYVHEDDLEEFLKYALGDIKDDFIIDGLPLSMIKNDIAKVELFGDINEKSIVEFTLKYTHNDGHKSYGFSDVKTNDANIERIESFISEYSEDIDTNLHVASMSLDREKTYEFLNEGLELLMKRCDVFISDALKSVGTKKRYAISVGVHVKSNLLELNINSTDFPIDELSEILKSYRKRKRFYRLKNGQLISLESDDLDELNQVMNDNNLQVDKIKQGTLQVPLYRSFGMNETLDKTNHLLISRSASFTNCIKNFNSQENDFKIKPHYKAILREYQSSGVQWLSLLKNYQFGGILADDMGLGKTLQVIALLDSLESKLPNLVICPASLILNWEDEVRKFSPTLKCLAIHGTQSYRQECISHIEEYDLCVTSYDYIKRDLEFYQAHQFNYVILDEAQYIKNQKTKNATSVKALNCINRLALTGTPIENSLAELWSIFDFLMPNYLFNYHYFKNHFEVPIVKENNDEIQGKLKRLVEPFILRRLKSNVLKELPEKFEQTITIDFNEDEEKLYLAHAMQIAKELQSQIKSNSVDKIQVLAMITKLRQLCIEPRILFENIYTNSSKMEACLDIIQTFNENKKKILLFSSFTSVFKYFIEELAKQNIKFHLLTGETDKLERHKIVDEFQNDDSTVFLISLKAGGTGLNLTAAEGVIHFDPWWNLSAQNQATDRTHRIGQKNIVQVYKLIMKNSIEEKITKLQETKKNLADTFIENNEGSLTRLSPEQLLDLFKIE